MCEVFVIGTKEEDFNEDYFERGLECGISCYQNYRWIPELTIPMAMTIIDYLKLKPEHTILDFGCAKGYLVKALRLLKRQAWGYDISQYAISRCDPDVRDYCFLDGEIGPRPRSFDFIIAKDVFEHIEANGLGLVLSGLNSEKLFAVIPLGDGKVYRAPVNNCDRTHRICADEHWWIDAFEKGGWQIEDFRFKIEGIKDHYYEKFPEAHGFFLLKNTNLKEEKEGQFRRLRVHRGKRTPEG